MLIINADDLGRDREITNRCLDCYENRLITSASAMVFMEGSQFAAERAATASLETGLHLNYTLPFDSPEAPLRLKERQASILSYLNQAKWMSVLYNPLLKRDFEYVYQRQFQEYCRLYGEEPAKIDGHHHMHLCMNMIINPFIPSGQRVRRNLTFGVRQKSIVNRAFRKIVDAWLLGRYCCTDFVFGFEHLCVPDNQKDIIRKAHSLTVELVVHPGITEEYNFINSSHFKKLVSNVPKGTYGMLVSSKRRSSKTKAS